MKNREKCKTCGGIDRLEDAAADVTFKWDASNLPVELAAELKRQADADSYIINEHIEKEIQLESQLKAQAEEIERLKTELENARKYIGALNRERKEA